MVDAGAILFTVLTATLEIRHYIYSGDIYYASAGLTEVALQVSGGLAMVIGLERLRLRTNSIVHNVGGAADRRLLPAGDRVRAVAAANPWIWSTNVGGLFVNLNLLGYAIPAVLAAALGLMTRHTRPQAYRTVAAITAVVLALTYLSFQVARFYQGPRLSVGPGQRRGRLHLLGGVARLRRGAAGVGMVLRSQPVRLCSAAVVLVTVAKVFLLDMAGLAGVWRSLSFIGLGLVLVGIGFLYRRMFATAPPPAEAAPPAA